MRLTIIPSDGVVGVDGVFRQVDMSGIDPAIHAVQWDDAAGEGEIEFKGRGITPERITDRARFNVFVERWTAAEPPPPPPPPPPLPRQAGPVELQRALIKKGVITQAELDAELT